MASALSLSSSLACRVPREVHEPRTYPEVHLSAQSISVRVVDVRPAPTSSSQRQLLLPTDFERAAQARLSPLAAGQGPALDVQTLVSGVDLIDLVDSRGEMTRISVNLDFEVKVHEGPVLRRAHTQSNADIPRDEASAEEIDFVLRATALDAFDRYWASAETAAALNADLAAYAMARKEPPAFSN